MRKVQGYGWHPDLPDSRDRVISAQTGWYQVARLPAECSLRHAMPHVYSQGQLGSCTANAIAGAVEYQQHKQGEHTGTPSRLFVYYNEREIEGTVDADSGAMIRDGIKVVATLGAPKETLWPYQVDKFTQRPPQNVYAEAAKHKALTYARVARSDYYYRAVLAAGTPIVFGFVVYTGFESQGVADTGIMRMPSPGESVIGGHAVLIVGYKLIDGVLHYEVRNSWGADWGDHGYFWMPRAYLAASTGLASDFWAIRLET